VILERMASELGLPSGFILSLARSASHEYKTYRIAKRNGEFRTIHHPSRRLKALQRWLLRNVIANLPVHAAAAAYRPRRSILDNASRHVASGYLLRMDFANFFPSITQVDLARYIAERRPLFDGWAPQDIDLFCRLVCRHAVLTIGAPTSPGLSNALCYDLDVALATISVRGNVTYTRYADDLFFSTTQKGVLRDFEQEVERAVEKVQVPAGLRMNRDKTRHSSKRGARRVTGIVLGSDGKAHVGRKRKREIRALIHRYDTLDDARRASLAGMIAYATGLDPAFMNRLIDKYGLRVVRRAMRIPNP